MYNLLLSLYVAALYDRFVATVYNKSYDFAVKFYSVTCASVACY